MILLKEAWLKAVEEKKPLDLAKPEVTEDFRGWETMLRLMTKYIKQGKKELPRVTTDFGWKPKPTPEIP